MNTKMTLEEALLSKSMKHLAAAGLTAATIATHAAPAAAITLNPNRIIDARGNTAADPYKADREAAQIANQEKIRKEKAAKEAQAAKARAEKEKASNEWKNKLGAEFARGSKK